MGWAWGSVGGLATGPDRALGLDSWLVVSLVRMIEVGVPLERMHKDARMADMAESRNLQESCIL